VSFSSIANKLRKSAKLSAMGLWKSRRQSTMGIAASCCLLITSLLAPAPSTADQFTSEKRDITVEKLLDGLANPWSIAFIDENNWLITERPGRLRQVANGKLLDAPVQGLPAIDAIGQGGLLDVVLHPDFKTNQWVYLSFAGMSRGLSGTEVVRGKLVGNNLTESQVIFKATPKHRGGRHFGSRLAFDDKGFLFITLGDRGDRETAQRGKEHTGSIIRLNDDGSIPADNPYINNAAVLDEIYSMGHRNVQGLVIDKDNDVVWAHEHGPQGGDELNNVLPGRNYGWPIITYGVNYGSGTKIGIGNNKPGFEQPAWFWDPSIAPSGMELVTSNRYPQWQGNLLVGALKFQLIARLEITNGKVTHEERILGREYGRIRDIRQGLDGWLYFLTDSKNGGVYRIK